jgi:signal transduction histidine kinase
MSVLLSLAANHAATAFQSARLIHERMRAEEELRKARDELELKVAERTAELTASRARVVAAAAEERQRVVRDLHDGAQQRLVATVINLKLAVGELGNDDGQVEGLVGEALEHAEKANFELRELAHGILPRVLTSGGLRASVEELANRWALPVTVDVSPRRFSPAIEATAYFVVSEALTNAIKHSGAHAAAVHANVEGSELRVEVRDDGVGGADPGKGSGLTGLRDRVEALGGTTEIASPAGGGTSLLARIPIAGR